SSLLYRCDGRHRQSDGGHGCMGHERIATTRLYNHPGTKQIRDAIERRNQLPKTVCYWSPVISPDGKTIAVEVEGANSGLATMNIDGSGFKVIAQGSNRFSWPAFSTDGSKILVTYYNSTWGGFNINAIDLDGTNQTALTISNYDQCPLVVGDKVLLM